METDFLAYKREVWEIMILFKCSNSSIQVFNTNVEAIL